MGILEYCEFFTANHVTHSRSQHTVPTIDEHGHCLLHHLPTWPPISPPTKPLISWPNTNPNLPKLVQGSAQENFVLTNIHSTVRATWKHPPHCCCCPLRRESSTPHSSTMKYLPWPMPRGGMPPRRNSPNVLLKTVVEKIPNCQGHCASQLRRDTEVWSYDELMYPVQW